MPVCAVVDLETNKLVNTIIADPSIEAPIGCKLVELAEGCYWDEVSGTAMKLIFAEEITDGN